MCLALDSVGRAKGSMNEINDKWILKKNNNNNKAREKKREKKQRLPIPFNYK